VPRSGNWITRHNGFVDLAKQGNIDVLFLGDSITDFWRDDNPASLHRGKPVWDQYYGSLKAVNFGISGDRTEHVLWRLQNGEGQGFKPKVIVLMIGTNNTGLQSRTNPKPRNTVPEATAGVIAVVQELRKDFPDAKILLLGIFPRGAKDDPQRQQVADINTAISALNDDQHIFYFYFGDQFLDPDGNIPKDIMADSLHPTTKGYQIWAEAMEDELAKLLK
jgi:lysophospholipase L1-like esterase